MTAPSQMTTRIHRDVRGKRYGEVLLVKSGDDGLFAEVFNSFTLNECPQDLWDKLDLAAIAETEGALAAVANGPRYWLMHTIEKSGPEVPEVHDFGGILMSRAAVLNFGTAGVDPSPYKGRRVARTAMFCFAADSMVYELTDPDGAVYVMQSWCTSVDTALSESDLGTLGGRLEVPEGWSYGQRRLSQDLNVMTTTEDAVVLQDELKNSYCLAV
jgi:hypothetical protein